MGKNAQLGAKLGLLGHTDYYPCPADVDMHSLLWLFFQSAVVSVVFSMACWGGGLGPYDANKLMTKASSVTWMELGSMYAVTEKGMKGNLKALMNNPSYRLPS